MGHSPYGAFQAFIYDYPVFTDHLCTTGIHAAPPLLTIGHQNRHHGLGKLCETKTQLAWLVLVPTTYIKLPVYLSCLHYARVEKVISTKIERKTHVPSVALEGLGYLMDHSHRELSRVRSVVACVTWYWSHNGDMVTPSEKHQQVWSGTVIH